MCTTHHSPAKNTHTFAGYVFICLPATLVITFPSFQGTNLLQVPGSSSKRYGDELTEEFNSESPWIDGVISAFHDEPFHKLEGTAAPLEDSQSSLPTIRCCPTTTTTLVHPLSMNGDPWNSAIPSLKHRYYHDAKRRILPVWSTAEPGIGGEGEVKMGDTRECVAQLGEWIVTTKDCLEVYTT